MSHLRVRLLRLLGIFGIALVAVVILLLRWPAPPIEIDGHLPPYDARAVIKTIEKRMRWTNGRILKIYAGGDAKIVRVETDITDSWNGARCSILLRKRGFRWEFVEAAYYSD